MVVFHRTTASNVRSILRDGFRDGSGTYGIGRTTRGVFFSDTPLDINEGAGGSALLSIELPTAMLAKYEWIEDAKSYREFQVPAKVAREHGRHLRIATEDRPLRALGDQEANLYLLAAELEELSDDSRFPPTAFDDLRRLSDAAVALHRLASSLPPLTRTPNRRSALKGRLPKKT